MANDMQRCPIWSTPVKQIIRYPGRDNLLAVQGSPRTDGNYEITAEASSYLGSLDESQKVKVTTRIIEERRNTGQTPLVTPQLIEAATRADPLPVYVRAERLLRYLANKRNPVGHSFVTQDIIEDVGALAWSESSTPNEVAYFVSYLMNMSWLTGSMNAYCTLTVSGYQHVAEQATKKDLSQCFVAMWFDPSMDSAYEEGIKKAVEACGYKPMRIDKKLDVNKIDDEILAEIRRSRFVVADFTHSEKEGVRGGVYYEAGFAYGLGLEVFYACREDLKDELHFDTRQYHHILWTTPEDLRTQLRDRIRARVGDYTA